MRHFLVITATVYPLLFAELPPAFAASPPRMLFQSGEIKDAEAAGGARTAFAIMRLPDGSFAFYDRYSPKTGPLRLPDSEGRPNVLLPHLPPEILASDVILESGVLNNTQVILSDNGEVKSVTVRNESLDRETAARVGLPRYLNVNPAGECPASFFEPLDDLAWLQRVTDGVSAVVQWLDSLVPHGSLGLDARAVPPLGRHKTVIEYQTTAE